MPIAVDALTLLPALVALVETESVTEAARRLGVGQPAMSKTLARLRDATGDALLVRAGRRVVRTQVAASLLPEAVAALDSVRGVFARPEPFSPATARGTVTFAIGDDLTSIVVAPLLRRLREAAPGLDLRILPVGRQSLDDARRGLVDVAVAPDLGPRAMPDLSEFVRRQVYVRRFTTVTRKPRTFTLDSFCAAEHLLVAPFGTDSGYVDDALEKLGRRRRVAATVPTFTAALSLVAQTDLVATLPDDVVTALAPDLARRRCPVETPQLPLCLFWHARMTTDPRHRWLRAEVEAVVHSRGGHPGTRARSHPADARHRRAAGTREVR